jgi:hypothetical protein
MRKWRGAWHVDLGVGEERRPRTAWRGPGRSMTACWALPHARKDEPFNFYNSSPGPSTCMWRELETGPHNTAESEWGPHDWSVLSPTAAHRGKRTTSCCTLDSTLGAYVGLGEVARTWRLNTGRPMGSWKWTGATRQERAEPHGQFTGIDDFIARATSTVGPRGRHQGRQHGKAILVLAWR